MLQQYHILLTANMRQIPKNRIIENQHSNGFNISLRFSISKIPYVGYYHVINGNKYFTGKTHEVGSKELEKYDMIKTATSTIAAAGSIAVSSKSTFGSQNKIRYFYKDNTSSDILIKEIDKNTFDKLSGIKPSTYDVISFDPQRQNLNEVNKHMPGLKEFLET